MRGRAYAIMRFNNLVAISLSRQNAEEILADYVLDESYYSFMYYFNVLGVNIDVAMQEAEDCRREWCIREFDLV